MKMILERKILTGFIVCCLVLFVVGVISYKNSERFVATSHSVNHTHAVLYALEEVLVGSVDAEARVRGFVITGDEIYLEPFNSHIVKRMARINSARELTKDNPAQQENIEAIQKLVTAHVTHLAAFIELRRATAVGPQIQLRTIEGKRVLDEIRKTIAIAKEVELVLLKERSSASDDDAANFNFFFFFLLLVIVLVIIAVYITLSINLRALRRSESETTSRNWSLAGIGELVKGMQGNKTLDDLSQTIIHHLATYLDVQIGAIYITEKDGVTLRLTGGHSINKEKKDSPSVRFGEGIVGQAAAEKRTVVLTDFLPDYFTIHTSFGEVVPRGIIAVPFVFENCVMGVIELGSVQGISELQKQYVEAVADSIAIAITASQSRAKTRELLDETRQQAEELETQQEELKVSHEELYAKTKLLERSEQELKVQEEGLRQSNEELKGKANLLEDQKDKLENAKAEIETKVHEIEVTSRYKSEFLANMSHELRTPLNSILILAQLIAENKNNTVGQKDADYAKNIYNSGNDLLNLIDEILDLSKVEAGKLQLDIGETPFYQIIGSINSLFSEMAKKNSIDFSIVLSKDLPPAMTTDGQRVEQILRNLLSNAFKFTRKGGTVTVAIDQPPAGIAFKNKLLNETPGIVAFAVTDTGIGIADDKLNLIFEAFQQVDGSTKRKYGGTGLGLSISRELALVLGGEIQLKSMVGKGSAFTLYLPLQFDRSHAIHPEKPVEIREKPLEKKGRKVLVPVHEAEATDDRHRIQVNDRVILIIEGDEQFAGVLLDFVRERNYKGVVARQGNTGISYARHYKPDAILMDMMLPVMDGSEVLKQIKNDPELRHIPVQIISANGSKKEGMRLGAFDCIKKPVTLADLQKVFDNIEGFASKKPKKLLIVEDNEVQNNTIRELIGNGDVKCFSAYRGAEAFQMLEKEGFDCIIVDLGLPDMSGFELLEKINKNDKLSKIPIVVYTGKELTKADNDRLERLADTVVLKTADSPERLLDETILFLHRVESRLPVEKQTMIRKLHQGDEVLKGKKILLADDDIRNIYSLSSAMEEEGMICITAGNGVTALEALKADPAIDLVLMDVMMPVMDGYEATLEIRKMPEFSKLPIIALTAKAMKEDKEKCLAVGMSDYVSKPVNANQLLSLMRVWLYR